MLIQRERYFYGHRRNDRKLNPRARVKLGVHHQKVFFFLINSQVQCNLKLRKLGVLLLRIRNRSLGHVLYKLSANPRNTGLGRKAHLGLLERRAPQIGVVQALQNGPVTRVVHDVLAAHCGNRALARDQLGGFDGGLDRCLFVRQHLRDKAVLLGLIDVKEASGENDFPDKRVGARNLGDALQGTGIRGNANIDLLHAEPRVCRCITNVTCGDHFAAFRSEGDARIRGEDQRTCKSHSLALVHHGSPRSDASAVNSTYDRFITGLNGDEGVHDVPFQVLQHPVGPTRRIDRRNLLRTRLEVLKVQSSRKNPRIATGEDDSPDIAVVRDPLETRLAVLPVLVSATINRDI